MTDKLNRNLCIGDVFGLFSIQGDGTVIANRHLSIPVSLRLKKHGVIPQYRDGTFELHTFKNYTQKTRLQNSKERRGSVLSRRGSEASVLDDNVVQLEAAAAKEEQENEVRQRQAIGTAVVYGQIVEIVHKRSMKFLKVDGRTTAIGNPSALAVSLGVEDETAWWKIVPKFKMRQEGEKVRTGEQVLLQHVKTGHLLNVGTKTLDESLAGTAHMEMLADTNSSGFRVDFYRSHAEQYAPREQFILGSEIGRFFNKESEGVLTLANAQFAMGATMSHSNAMLMLEHEDNTEGQAFQWKDRLRLFHVGTAKYVDVDTSKPTETESGKQYPLHLVDAPAAGVFVIESMFTEADADPLSHAMKMRLRHVESNTYLHTAVTPGQQVFATETAFEEDVMFFIEAEPDETSSMDHLSGVLPILDSYRREFEAQRKPAEFLTNQAKSILTSLIYFLYQNQAPNSVDPLVYEDITDTRKQDIAAEQGVIDLLVGILAAPFDRTPTMQPKPAAMTLQEIKDVKENATYFHNCKLCYRFLKQVMKQNTKCAKHVAKYLDFMQGQLGYQLKTAETLMELFTDSRFMLDKITQTQVEVFTNLIKTVGKLSRYMNFILALITCKGEGVPRNQNMICDLLFSQDLLLHTQVSGETLEVDVQSAMIQPGKPQWVAMDQFLQMCIEGKINFSTREKDSDLLVFFERSIQTLAGLCVGRNDASIETISRHFSAQLCLQPALAAASRVHALRSSAENLDVLTTNHVVFGTAFLSLFRSAYLDVSPMQQVSDVRTLQVWTNLAPALPAAPNDALQAFSQWNEPVKDLVFRWLQGIGVQREGEREINTFSLAIVKVLNDLIRFGLMSDVGTMKQAIDILITCLDGRNDECEENGKRQRLTVGTRPIMLLKEAILDSFGVINNLRDNWRVLQLLTRFKSLYEGGSYRNIEGLSLISGEQIQQLLQASGNAMLQIGTLGFMGRSSQVPPPPPPSRLQTSRETLRRKRTTWEKMSRCLKRNPATSFLSRSNNRFQDVFSFLVFRTKGEGVNVPKSQTELVAILQDLTQYSHEPLSAKAFGFLLSHFSQQRRIHNTLKETVLLVDEEDTVIFTTAAELSSSFRSHVKFSMDDGDVQGIVKIADSIYSMCRVEQDLEAQGNRQKLVVSQQLHTTALRLLNLRCPLLTKNPTLETTVRSAAHKILQALAINNPSMQAILFGHLRLFLGQAKRLQTVSQTLAAIFGGNKELCSKITPDLVAEVVDVIALGTASGTWYQCLTSMVQVNNIPLLENQALVLKVLLEKRRDLKFLDDGESLTSPERVAAADAAHFAALVQLLASITDRNQIMQAKCESLVSRSMCTAQLANKNLPSEIRVAFVQLFTMSHLRNAPVHMLTDNITIASAVFMEHAIAEGFLYSDWAEPLLEMMSTLLDSASQVVLTSKQKSTLGGASQSLLQLGTKVSTLPLHSDLKKKTGRPETARTKNKRKSFKTAAEPIDTPTTDLELNSLTSTSVPPVSKAIPVLLFRVIFNLVQLDILNQPSETVDTLCPGLRAKMKQAASVGGAEQDSDLEIQLAYNAFRREFAAELGFVPGEDEAEQLTPEELDLMQLFMDDGLMDDKGQTLKTAEMPATLTDDYLERWNPKNRLTMNLMRMLAFSPYLGVDVKRIALLVLKKLALHEVEDGITLAESQERLDKLGEFMSHSGSASALTNRFCGATRMVLTMISNPQHNDVLPQVLQFGNALMEGGNRKVQERVLDYMMAGHSNLFRRVKDVIHESIAKIRDQFFSVSQITRDHTSPEFTLLFAEVKRTVCVDDLFRFVQQTCEGHFLPCQRYWQEQSNSSKSYNIVAEIVEFINAMVDLGINNSTIGFVTQGFETLVELVQGPCTENQIMIAGSALPGLCVDILEMDSVPGCEGEGLVDVQNLKENAALLLSSLLEGCTDSKIPSILAREINLDQLFGVLREVYMFKLEVERPPSNEEAIEMLEEKLETAFEVFVLIRRLAEFDANTQTYLDKRLVGDSLIISKEDREAAKYFMKHTASIEINQGGLLQRVVFRIPSVCRMLSRATKLKLMQSADRSTPGSKLTDIVENLGDIHYEMVHQLSLRSNIFLHLRKHDRHIQVGSFLLAVLLNGIMLGTWTFNEDKNKAEFKYDWVDPLVLTLGAIATAGTIVSYLLYMFQFARIFIRKQFRDVLGYEDDVLEVSGWHAPLAHVKNLAVGTIFLIFDPKTLYEVTKVAFGIVGLVHHRFFFSIFLLDIVLLSIQLQGVIRAITSNGVSLILTGMLIAVVIYIYGGIGFLAFRTDFGEDANGNSLCRDLWQCTVVSINGGLRASDIAAVMNENEWGSAEILFYKFSYFVIVVLLLLNVILGIVLDTFAELRQEAIDIEDSLNNYCFVCSIDRQTFDRYADGFEKHIQSDHNLWRYVYFLVKTLYLKEATSHTGPESYVAQQIEEQNVDFFPISQAIVLRARQEKESEEQQALANDVKDTKNLVADLTTQVAELRQDISRVTQALQQPNN